MSRSRNLALIRLVIPVVAAGICSPQAIPTVAKVAGSPPAPTTAAVGENDVVLTIRNVCEPPSASPCETQITRGQFERMFRTVKVPNGPFPLPTTSARRYARLLALADEARKEGIDKTSGFQEQLQFIEIQMLATALQDKIRADEADISDKDIQTYYEAHRKQFEEVSVRCVMVPPIVQPNGPTGKEPPAISSEEIASKALADTARKRLVAGEDPDKVEKDIFAAVAPNTAPTVRRRNPYFPAPEENAIFDLEVGQVSNPIPSGAGGFDIYRLESKRLVPLDAARDEIQKVLKVERVQARLNEILAGPKIVLDPRYFKGEKAEREAKERDEAKERAEHQQ